MDATSILFDNLLQCIDAAAERSEYFAPQQRSHDAGKPFGQMSEADYIASVESSLRRLWELSKSGRL